MAYVYKYFSINEHALKSLENAELYFSEPDKFNDLFDGTYSVGDLNLLRNFKDKIPEGETTYIHKALLNLFEKQAIDGTHSTRICCFTIDNDNPLMWSHYANSHSGMCLQMEADESSIVSGSFELSVLGMSFDEKKYRGFAGGDLMDISNKAVTIFLHPVRYQKEKPLHLNMNPAKKHSLIPYYLIKDKVWSYEKEYRAVIEHDILKSNLVKIERNRLKGIIFGARTSEENKKRVREVISKEYLRKGFTVTFSQVRMDQSKRGNALKIERIPL